jgi:hypothetical protein
LVYFAKINEKRKAIGKRQKAKGGREKAESLFILPTNKY